MTIIDRVVSPTIAEFEQEYLIPGRPVILQGISDQWPAFGKWTPEYLSELAGDRLFPVVLMTDGDYVGARNDEMTLHKYLEKIPDQNSGNDKIYLAETSITKYFPELVADIVVPPFFTLYDGSPAMFIYIGQNTFSQLHYHSHGSATLCPVYGSKHVRLFPPDQTRLLYKYPWYSENRNMSQTKSIEPETSEFPMFKEAQYVDLEIKAGEILFIPLFWWHAIQNKDLNIAVVVSWGRDPWRRVAPWPLFADYLYNTGKEIPEILRTLPSRLLSRI